MLEALIQQYGYFAIVVGTFLEGETVLLLGGFAAHRGYLDLPLVMAAAFAGSVVGDQIYFAIGRRRGMAFLDSRPAWRPRVTRVLDLVHRHQTAMILGFRFLYGIRTVAPFALGASGVSLARFTALNALSAALWAIAGGALGYLLGNALQAVIGDLERYEPIVFAAIVLAGVTAWLWRRARTGRSAQPLPS